MGNRTGRDETANNRKKIIKRATRLFGEKGVEGTSLSDIAKEVGISKGTLYYYYASKNDLIFDITEEHMQEITGGIFSMIEKNKGEVGWREMLKLLMERLLKSETRTRLHLYLIQEVLSGNIELKRRFNNTYKQWFQMVVDGFDMLTQTGKDISIQARLLVSVIDGLIIQSSIGLEEVSLDTVIEDIAKIIDP